MPSSQRLFSIYYILKSHKTFLKYRNSYIILSMKVKTLIVGLGNPGTKYDNTRHNTGFMVLDSLCEGEFQFSKKFDADLCALEFGVYLMKPQTFMNLSGNSVGPFTEYYQLESKNIWIIHDDIDIPFGEIRVRKGGSSAGHKGVDSIIERLGTKHFLRFRVGVKNKLLKNYIETEDFVLQRFSKSEEERLQEIVDLCIFELKNRLKEGKEETKTLKIDI